MAGTTQVNYDEMSGIIKTLQTEEDEIMNLLKTTKSKVESLHNNQWIGQGADNFFNEMEQTVLPALARLARALGVGADVAQKVVDTIRQADEETQSFFNNIGG
jgi:WXG100 family type VII secretion target